MATVDASYEYCLRVARSRAKNFYYSFVLLSAQQRKAMCAIYAFMRYCDDLSDEPGASRAAVERWKADMEEALEGRFTDHPVWPAFHHTVRRFGIPHEYFRQMIDGISSDLEPRTLETFDELYRYCYQVASVVGLTIIHIFGFDTRSALPLAEKCGVAFQLTNILRDIREDAERGRIYLPAEDLRRFGVSAEDLRAGRRTPEFLALMQFEAERARDYYNQSLPLLELIHPRSKSSLWALISIYSNLLDRIVATNYDVFSRRVRLSLLRSRGLWCGRWRPEARRFGNMTQTLSIRLDPGIKEQLDALAKRTGRSRSFLAAEAIAAYVESEEWHVGELQSGTAELDAGQEVGHEKVSKWLKSWGKPGETKAPK